MNVYKKEISSSYKQSEYKKGEFYDKISQLNYRKIYNKSLHNLSYFAIYCNNEHYIPLIGSPFFLVDFGSILITPIQDKYGRKKIFNILTFISCIMHINLFFSKNPFHIIIICFNSGFCYTIYGMFGIIMYEFLPRNTIGIIMTFSNATILLQEYYYLSYLYILIIG